MTTEVGAVTRSETRIRHPIHLALEWKRVLNSDGNMTLAKIAREKGFSRARVTQIMHLLCLDERIQKHFLKITAATDIAFFSERQLRVIAALKSMEQQIAAFKALVVERDHTVEGLSFSGQA
ncbi:MAG: hypothetical protein PHP98_03230 [Kiritimatiellae bacterium]|nr:hypothetical protein [Kiritimatiellia bacterium]